MHTRRVKVPIQGRSLVLSRKRMSRTALGISKGEAGRGEKMRMQRYAYALPHGMYEAAREGVRMHQSSRIILSFVYC
jgi:hypothetical protein